MQPHFKIVLSEIKYEHILTQTIENVKYIFIFLQKNFFKIEIKYVIHFEETNQSCKQKDLQL